LPRIIRSSGVNIERARPLVMPLKAKKEVEALIEVSAGNREAEMERIKVSAELIVEEIISKARNDADNMLVDARQETINVLQDAVREGWEQGMHDALKQATALQEAAMLEIDTATESLIDERRCMFRNLERDVLELVFDIVDKVLAVEMDRSSEWITSMVKSAMQQMEGDDMVVLKVAEGARERVAAIADKLIEVSGKRPGRLSIVVDAKLGPGGCIIETDKGSINNSIEGKVGKLKTILRENT
jgi:flagellar assembly protein FliH